MSTARPGAVAWLRRLEGIVSALNHVVVFAAMVVVVLFTFGQAVDRYLIKSSFSAHDQVAKIGLVWLVFAGMAVAYARGENLRIDLIGKYLPPALRRTREVLFEAAILGIVILVNIKAWDVMRVAAFQQIMGTPFTNVVPYSAIVAGSAAIALSALVRVLGAFSNPHPDT